MRENNFVTITGDEFILSVVADSKNNIKNAGAYIYRFWTGRFRLISTNYRFNQISILHVPAEKTEGMLRIYKRYIAKKKKPSKPKVHRMLHLSSPGIMGAVKSLVRKILNNY